ncbi:hypothetical protein M408DRAFT_328683 [Serendipita vermifera MAFF 305830]|uniref:Vacuolar ATPase assembly integral membrane protein VMA21 n=1 Tax=Serendipita vermifera MAFF 305830 TaxID=933852 RepID=A0A0C3BBA4_SERVB|nr:hypothetical protein M408DRAFT_328683 [Serendipita vermifera MAFF 305830]
MAEQVAATKISEKAEEGGVLAKLMIFSLALGIAPITAYFGTQKYLTPDNSIYPAVAAVVVANIILFGYVIVAFREDAQAQKMAQTRKTQ